MHLFCVSSNCGWYFIIDLYSDDLFDDEDDAPKKKAKDAAPKKEKYLDQKWKLSEEDGKEFKGDKTFSFIILSNVALCESTMIKCFGFVMKGLFRILFQIVDAVSLILYFILSH